MKKMFKDPIAPTEREPGKMPWSFKCPTKDQAQSGNLQCGDQYGIGFRTPMGKEKATPMSAGPIPQMSMCRSASEVINEEV